MDKYRRADECRLEESEWRG